MLAVALCVAACASPVPADLPAQDGRTPSVVEDAGPRTYAEDEVDVPARPLAPIRPAYPPGLRELGVEGDVEARVLVRADGGFGGARLVASDHPGFTAAAREALAHARFEPALLAESPVASWVTVRLRFRLEE